MFSLFRYRPLIDPASADWIYQAFDWALIHFDAEEFFSRTRLVQPNNEFFPGQVDSVHAKASNIFSHTLKYAGLPHWPFRLLPPEQYQPQPLPDLSLSTIERRSDDASLPSLTLLTPLDLSYNPQQTLKPADLAASYAQWLAQFMMLQSGQQPPGGNEYLAEATEVLGVFMGFGVLFANSAYTFRGGCGSCYNAMANRQAALSEPEVVFALALFCRVKGISDSEATGHLKKHLRGVYRKALKQIDREPESLKALLGKRPIGLPA